MPRRLVVLLFVPAALIAVGTLGYSLIEDWSLFDSLYMTVTTLSTVGYQEVHPLSAPGRVFTMLLLLGGVATLVYASSEIVRAVVSGELRSAREKRQMEQDLALMRDHMVVCGYGRMGRYVCKEFEAQALPFVVLDREGPALEEFQPAHGLALHGDATNDELLKRAGVDRARALITVVASDADNLYITMTARLMSDRLFIVARAESELAEQKLIRAGANRVVSPYVIGGRSVAQAVLRPAVLDFIDLATRTEHLELQIEEAQIAPASALAGASLRDSRLRQDRGVIIVAIKKASGAFVYNPPGDAVIEAGDTLITLGNRAQLDRLEALARG